MPLGVELVVEVAAVEDQVDQEIVVHPEYIRHVEWMYKLHHALLSVCVTGRISKFSTILKLFSKDNKLL